MSLSWYELIRLPPAVSHFVVIGCEDVLLQLVSMECYPFLPLQLLWVLDHLAAVTNQPAETPNERNFQADYGETIKLAIQRLQNPSNYKTPHIVWEPFKQVCCTRGLERERERVQVEAALDG